MTKKQMMETINAEIDHLEAIADSNYRAVLNLYSKITGEIKPYGSATGEMVKEAKRIFQERGMDMSVTYDIEIIAIEYRRLQSEAYALRSIFEALFNKPIYEYRAQVVTL